MELLRKDDLAISTIEEKDKNEVLNLFANTEFCNSFSNDLRPTNVQFMSIMNGIISGKDDESNILVLRKNDKFLGYLSMFVEYDRLNLGHIAVKEDERGKGYGTMLTNMAISIAENEGRDVFLFCDRKNALPNKLDFNTEDGIFYFHKNKGIKNENLPKLFVSIEDYVKRKEDKRLKELSRFKEYLDYCMDMDIFN